MSLIIVMAVHEVQLKD